MHYHERSWSQPNNHGGSDALRADTITAHSWAVCLPTVLVATMAVLHDPTECVTGDFPAGLQRIAPEVAAALEPCIAELPLTGLGGRGHLMSVLNEYEAGSSAPAKILKFADIIDAWDHLLVAIEPGISHSTREKHRVVGA